MNGKNVLIVYAHPEKQSLLGSLKDRTVEVYKKMECNVTVRDLYALNFKATGGPDDFTELSDLGRKDFKYAPEQKHAFTNGYLKDDISTEVEHLRNADLVLFVFPMWWGSVPAILKGYFDRVLLKGFAWDVEPTYQLFQSGIFKGKRAALICTTAMPPEAYQSEGMSKFTVEELMEAVTYGTLAFVGMSVYPTFVANGVSPMADKKILSDHVNNLESYIKNLEKSDLLWDMGV